MKHLLVLLATPPALLLGAATYLNAPVQPDGSRDYATGLKEVTAVLGDLITIDTIEGPSIAAKPSEATADGLIEIGNLSLPANIKETWVTALQQRQALFEDLGLPEGILPSSSQSTRRGNQSTALLRSGPDGIEILWTDPKGASVGQPVQAGDLARAVAGPPSQGTAAEIWIVGPDGALELVRK